MELSGALVAPFVEQTENGYFTKVETLSISDMDDEALRKLSAARLPALVSLEILGNDKITDKSFLSLLNGDVPAGAVLLTDCRLSAETLENLRAKFTGGVTWPI